MPEDDDEGSGIPVLDFFDELQRKSDAIKAAAEAIEAAESAVDVFARSATLEIRNLTGRKLLFVDAGHAHGGFSLPPDNVIPANRSVVLGTRSSGLFTGTEGAARYNLDGTDIFYTINWSIPFLGSNDASASLEGEDSDKLVLFTMKANGNTNVPMKYMIGEKAALAPPQPDWRFCDKCKSLYFAPAVEKSDCPAGGRHSHVPTSLNFKLRHGVPGISHQGAWRMCVRCTGLFFNGVEGKKGVCPAPVAPIHAPEESYFLSHTATDNQPSDPTHEADWRICIDCFSLFFAPTNDGGCAANRNGPHRRFPDLGEPLPPNHPLAELPDKRPFNYRLQHGLADPPDHSIGWRRCGKCSVLFFEPEIEASNCPTGDTHEAASDSPVFQVSRGEPATGQSLGGWSRCKRCKGMFFGIPVDRGGRCPVPNRPGFRLGHKAGGFVFHLPHDFDGPGQSEWKFCTKCFCLVFEPSNTADVPCPAGETHVLQGFNFRLES